MCVCVCVCVCVLCSQRLTNRSCTAELEVLQDAHFLGASGDRTIFTVEAVAAVEITSYSVVGGKEAELLLPPRS